MADKSGGRFLNPWRIGGWGLAAGLLLTPLVAMRFTEEVDWTPSDFVFMGVLFLSVGLAFEFLVRASGSLAYRAGAGIALLGAFLLVWGTAAAGFIGAETNRANLMLVAVLAVGVIGSAVGRFRPAPMGRALLGAALVQGAIGVIALVGRMGVTDPSWPMDIIGLTGFFGGLWMVSAWLFHRAARQQTPAGAAA